MIYLRISAMVGALLAVFLFGMWLTWPDFPYNPSGFPINRNFVAVSLNGEPLADAELPQAGRRLEVRREFDVPSLRAFGYGGLQRLERPPDVPARRDRSSGANSHRTAVACGAPACTEERYLAALLGATRWRREERTLILENGTDILRFQLAPF